MTLICGEIFAARTATIGVFGLGYVGLPLSVRFADAGFRVLGFDVDTSKADALNAGRSYIRTVADDSVQRARAAGFEATTDMSRAAEADALIICVPTPLDEYRQPDLGYVRSTLDAIMPFVRKGQIISLESTTYPGTTEEEVLPRLEARGLKAGEDVFVVYSPEREDPGNTRFETRTIPKVVGGVTPACLEAGVALYEQAIDQIVPVSSTRTAELTKLLENIHRAVNIGLVNEMKLIAERMDIDIHEVIAAAATKPFGFVPYYPGPGLGGHCIPIDPFYLTWKAREYGLHTRFIELAGEINSAMPAHVVDRLVDALNERRKPLKGSRVLVLGLAYKKNVDDTRESPSVELLELLVARGAEVAYSDPYVPTFPKMRRHSFDLDSTPLDAEHLEAFDAVVIATDHDDVDYEALGRHAQLVIDTRGRMPRDAANVVTA